MNLPAYSKQSLTIEEQISLLKNRHIIIDDLDFTRRILENVSYYRISAYLYPFRKNDGSDDYVSATSFDKCWQYYRFDRRLRTCILDAIERVEVATKTKIVNHLSLTYGPFSYRNKSTFAHPLNEPRFHELLSFLNMETQKSKEEFVMHFNKTYDTSKGLPLWMAVEIMSFGNMLTLFRLMKKRDKQSIAKSLGSNAKILESWLVNLNYVRNICAHHGRLWNRHLAVNPLIPKEDPKWHEKNNPVDSRRIYSTLCILKVLLDQIAPQSHWKKRFYSLLQEFPIIHRPSMAIPNNFETSAIWQ